MKRNILTIALLCTSIIGFSQTPVTTTGGTVNNVSKFSGTYTIVNSTIFDNGTNVGIGTSAPTKNLSFLGTSAKTIWMERSIISSPGYNLTIQAGGATSAAANKNGGNLILSSGISTGTGSSNLILGVFPAGSSGSSDNAFTERMRILGNGNIGMGLTTPQAPLHLHSLNQKDDGGGGGGALSMVGYTVFQLTNSTTGTNADVGMEMIQFGNISKIKALSGGLELSTIAGFSVAGQSSSQVSCVGTLSLEATTGINLITTGGPLNSRAEGFYLWSPSGAIFKMLATGNVGIGTTTPASKLQVDVSDATVAIAVHSTTDSDENFWVKGNGNVYARDVRVTVNTFADYVFSDTYKLRSLGEVEEYIKQNKHLPDVPSADEAVANGISLGNMDVTLLQKIEELTLYMIDLKKENENLKERIITLENK